MTCGDCVPPCSPDDDAALKIPRLANRLDALGDRVVADDAIKVAPPIGRRVGDDIDKVLDVALVDLHQD